MFLPPLTPSVARPARSTPWLHRCGHLLLVCPVQQFIEKAQAASSSAKPSVSCIVSTVPYVSRKQADSQWSHVIFDNRENRPGGHLHMRATRRTGIITDMMTSLWCNDYKYNNESVSKNSIVVPEWWPNCWMSMTNWLMPPPTLDKWTGRNPIVEIERRSWELISFRQYYVQRISIILPSCTVGLVSVHATALLWLPRQQHPQFELPLGACSLHNIYHIHHWNPCCRKRETDDERNFASLLITIWAVHSNQDAKMKSLWER